MGKKGNKYAVGNRGGAPSKYDPKYCQMIIDYFEIEPFTIEEIPHYKNGEVNWVEKRRVANPLPKFHEFAKKIGVDTVTLHNWKAEHVEFFNAYNYARELQKYFLIENGLNNVYNSTAFQFTAKNITDMSDKVQTEHSGEIKQITGFTIK